MNGWNETAWLYVKGKILIEDQIFQAKHLVEFQEWYSKQTFVSNDPEFKPTLAKALAIVLQTS